MEQLPEPWDPSSTFSESELVDVLHFVSGLADGDGAGRGPPRALLVPLRLAASALQRQMLDSGAVQFRRLARPASAAAGGDRLAIQPRAPASCGWQCPGVTP